jgi:cyclase
MFIFNTLNRRATVVSLCLCFACILAANFSFGQESVRTFTLAGRGLSEDNFPRVQNIAENVYTYEALTGSPDDRYTTNTMFVVSDEGILVADGQGNVEETSRLVSAIAEISAAPITHVVIASDHGDHTAGNSAFPQSAQFIAHGNSAATLQRMASNPDREANAPPIVMPTAIVDEQRTINLGDIEIQILFLGRAHTGGDLFVYLPREKILFATEVFLNHLFSGFRSAYVSEWLAAMDKAERLDVEMYVPGHGFVDSPAQLREEWYEYKNHVQVVLDEVTRLHEAGLTVDEAIEQADFGKYGDWPDADYQGRIGIRRIYAELNGELP